MRKVITVGMLGKLKVLPSYEFRTSGESEEKPKQSYLEKKKIIKPDTQKQTRFFYSTNI
jgi:hypothetical protein